MTTPFGTFGVPADVPTWTAFSLGLVALTLATLLPRRCLRAWACAASNRTTVLLCGLAALAAALSVGYIEFYLRGGPRIIDATSYFLQARSFSQGSFTFPLMEPSASFRGRFLLTPESDPTRAGVIFPPGYPAALALGFLVRAPMLLGPLIAAGQVVATFVLAQQLFQRRRLALSAALLTALSAALTYHSADTMSHGWAALLLTLSLGAALTGRQAWVGVSGLTTGWLIATRPVTGLVAVLCSVLALRLRKGRMAPPELLAFAVGLTPGIVLLLLHQHAVTGEWLQWAQPAYYQRADGPPGCFRYGFGSGIGCVFEHGDFVRARLAQGHTLGAALLTMLRRLALHAGDIANTLLLAPWVVAGGLWAVRRCCTAWALVAAIGGVILGYAPFYFDGNYPGGGARLYADVLPLELVLLAFALDRVGWIRFAPSLALLGFALHVGHDHARLRDREGGRPMFELERVRQLDRGLIFVNTDHGFNLGHDPSRRDPTREVVVARGYDDAHDFSLWHSLGQPESYRYRYNPFAFDTEATLEPYTPNVRARFEAEAEWPPLSVERGWSHPAFTAEGCAPSRRGLLLREPESSIVLPLVRPDGPQTLEVAFVAMGRAHVSVSAGSRSASRSVDVGQSCFQVSLNPGTASDTAGSTLRITARGGVLLDYWTYRDP